MYTMELAGPLGTPLGLSQWKRASSRGEGGTSDFLSLSDSDIALESWEGLGPQDAFKKDSRGLSWVGVETLISLDLYRGP